MSATTVVETMEEMKKEKKEHNLLEELAKVCELVVYKFQDFGSERNIDSEYDSEYDYSMEEENFMSKYKWDETIVPNATQLVLSESDCDMKSVAPFLYDTLDLLETMKFWINHTLNHIDSSGKWSCDCGICKCIGCMDTGFDAYIAYTLRSSHINKLIDVSSVWSNREYLKEFLQQFITPVLQTGAATGGASSKP